jgi:anti-anti-sigma factor
MTREIGVKFPRSERNRVLSYTTSVSPETQAVTLAISGSADVLAVDEVSRACAAALELHGKVVGVDLAGITFICSTAIGKLISLNREIKDYGGKMTLVRVPREVLSLLHHARLDHLFEIAQ